MVKTPDGLSISVQEWGNPNGPEILFIHGFAQSYLSWAKQTRSDLAKTFRMITYDNRGHGGSDKPLEPFYYKEGKRWADEVQTVIDGLKLKRSVLVGWSYGGRIMCDYLTIYGQDKISGINFVGATTTSDPNLKLFGPGAALLGPMGSDNLEVNIDATRKFLRLCTVKPLSQEDFEIMLAFNMLCPAKVRVGMGGRTAQYTETLSKVSIPVLVTHGKGEQVVLPAMAEYTASTIKGARISGYENVGHCTFWEDSERFNSELAQFVKAASAR
jgi:pimeloyl-ACP methyl ester carboxylesterase